MDTRYKNKTSKKKRFIVIPLVLLILCGCTNYDSGISSEELMKNTAVIEMAQDFTDKYGLRLAGLGGGQEKGKTKDITLVFQSYELPMNKDESRRQIIIIEEEGLHFMNQQKQLIPFLADYPLTEENLTFFISHYLPNGDPAYLPYISTVSCYNTKIAFAIDVPNQHATFSREYEPYEEALKTVLEEQVEPGARWQLSSELKEQIRQRLSAKAQVSAEKEVQD